MFPPKKPPFSCLHFEAQQECSLFQEALPDSSRCSESQPTVRLMWPLTRLYLRQTPRLSSEQQATHSLVHSLIHSCTMLLPRASYAPGTVLGLGNTIANKGDMVSALMASTSIRGEQPVTHHHLLRHACSPAESQLPFLPKVSPASSQIGQSGAWSFSLAHQIDPTRLVVQPQPLTARAWELGTSSLNPTPLCHLDKSFRFVPKFLLYKMGIVISFPLQRCSED